MAEEQPKSKILLCPTEATISQKVPYLEPTRFRRTNCAELAVLKVPMRVPLESFTVMDDNILEREFHVSSRIDMQGAQQITTKKETAIPFFQSLFLSFSVGDELKSGECKFSSNDTTKDWIFGFVDNEFIVAYYQDPTKKKLGNDDVILMLNHINPIRKMFFEKFTGKTNLKKTQENLDHILKDIGNLIQPTTKPFDGHVPVPH